MKTSACWFGNKWKISTKKLNTTKSYEIEIDVAEIAKKTGEVILKPTILDAKSDEHYTTIKITDLNRNFVGRTLWKIKDFLSSIYRFDICEGVEIKWNGVKLIWVGFDAELHITQEKIRFKKLFEFEINNKPVSGWVGVLGKGHGSRKKAGFSIIQNKRVIQNSYKPTSIFGDQEEGGNDLVNQRLVGELYLDKFAVSHTKDKIIWEANEEDLLDEKIGEFCKDARELALTLRFTKDVGDGNSNLLKYKEEAVTILTSELKSSEVKNYLMSVQPYPEKIIGASYQKTSAIVKEENQSVIQVEIGTEADTIFVNVYFNEKSEFEPYVLTETTIEDNKVIVIINSLHPHVHEMQSPDAMTNFLRHCIYDGVAEWKAIKLRGSIQPFTIKFLKDGLLRIPFQIKSNKSA